MRAVLGEVRVTPGEAGPLVEPAVLPYVAGLPGVVAGLLREGGELVDRELELAQRERARNRHPAERALVVVARFFVRRRAHGKGAGRDHHHLRAARTFAKT